MFKKSKIRPQLPLPQSEHMGERFQFHVQQFKHLRRSVRYGERPLPLPQTEHVGRVIYGGKT